MRYSVACTSVSPVCAAEDVGASKTVFSFGAQSDCDAMTANPSVYRDVKCCNTDGCNFDPTDPGPAPKPPPHMACQVTGVRVATVAQSINSSSNCGGGHCYNMTQSQMKAYIGTPRFVPLEPNHFSCIDGRHDDEVVATPAGDMGIFLSSVFVYINGTSTPTDFSLGRIKVAFV